MAGTPADLFESFRSVAGAAPGRPLLRVSGGPALTAAELLDAALSAAGSLRDEGLGRGEVVLVAPAAGVRFVISMLAVWGCDAVALPADPQATPSELEDLRSSFAPRLELSPARGGGLHVEPIREPATGRRGFLPAGTAVIKVSSGSTGNPRGIAVTAGQLAADTAQLMEGMRIGPQDVNVAAVPMSHSYGLASLLMPLVTQGSPLLLVPGPVPDLLAAALSLDEPAVFPGVPYLFDLLARPSSPGFIPRGLRLCVSAGACLRPATATAFRQRFGLAVRAFYGTSETGGLCFDASQEGDAAIRWEGCVGTPLPGVELLLEGPEARIAARGGAVASGYLGPAGGSADGEFRGDLFLTGDTGRLDAEGRLHLTGRLGAMANVAGRKVNPREIEAAIQQMPGVMEAAVLAVKDETRGEALEAWVGVPGAGPSRDEVAAHLRSRLAAWKQPRRITLLAELPKTARGKLDRDALRGQARGNG